MCIMVSLAKLFKAFGYVTISWEIFILVNISYMRKP